MVSGVKCFKNCYGCFLGDFIFGGCRRSVVDVIDWIGYGVIGVKYNDYIFFFGYYCVNKLLFVGVEEYVYYNKS